MQSGIYVSQAGSGGGANQPDTLYGVIADRPVATSVASGTQYVATDIGFTYRSDGTNWFLLDSNDTPLENLTFTYSGGNLSTIVSSNRTLSYTYNGDGSINTISNTTEGWTKTFSYNGAGDVTGVTIS